MSLLGPQYSNRLKLWSKVRATLFETRGIDEELQKLLKPKIVRCRRAAISCSSTRKR